MLYVLNWHIILATALKLLEGNSSPLQFGHSTDGGTLHEPFESEKTLTFSDLCHLKQPTVATERGLGVYVTLNITLDSEGELAIVLSPYCVI